ncbi:MAG: hypothetical protein AVDCRST_MAG10-176, partial [uncultured Acidimicrobiales bacterium]
CPTTRSSPGGRGRASWLPSPPGGARHPRSLCDRPGRRRRPEHVSVG